MGVRPGETEKWLMDLRFGHDSLIALGTVEDGKPWVRTVNGYYENGSFYVITHALSNKMRQLKDNPAAAICGDWFTAQGRGENIGHPRDGVNARLADRIRNAFREWYDNGHTDENDPNVCILRIRLTEAVLFHHGTRYNLDFSGTEFDEIRNR